MKTNKILLIQPKNIYARYNYIPLGLISVGTTLRDKGYDVEVLPYFLEGRVRLKEMLEKNRYLFIGVSVMTSEVKSAYNITKMVKEIDSTPVVWGGWHSTLFAEQTFKSNFVDYVVVNEGDYSTIKIANEIYGGEVKSRILQEKQKVDIESLPLPDYTLVRNAEYFIIQDLTDVFLKDCRGKIRWLPYESSRGCPHSCAFCINVVTDNRQYRKKSSEKVLDEITYIVKKYNLTHVKIVDDNYFVDHNRALEISEGLIKRNLGITWDAECRVDYFSNAKINSKLLKVFKKSGLVQVTIGVESGSEYSLALMKKDQTVEQSERSIRMLNELGIYARCPFLIDVPGERKIDMLKTVKLIQKLKQHKYFNYGVTTYRPYPKSELNKALIEKGLFFEPKSLEEWLDLKYQRFYTSTDSAKPWSNHSKLAQKISFYTSLEAGIRLRNTQIKNLFFRIVNNIFISIAAFRNKFLFYNFPIDEFLYNRFKDFVLLRLVKQERK